MESCQQGGEAVSENYVYHVGVDDIKQAATSIAESSAQLRETLGFFQETVSREREYAMEWLNRFEAAVEKLTVAKEGSTMKKFLM